MRSDTCENIGLYRGEVGFSSAGPLRGFLMVIRIVTLQKQIVGKQCLSNLTPEIFHPGTRLL